MAYTPLFSEVLTKVGKLKTKKQKVEYLKQNNSDALRMVLKSSFDPKIVWQLPEGPVPFSPNEAEARKLYNFIQGGNNALTQNKREMMFVQMLEGLHQTEAYMLVDAKDKILHKTYKGLSSAVVKEAFNWDENYMLIENTNAEYDQYAKRANV